MQGANELIRKFQRLGGQHASQMVLTAVHQGAKFVQAEAKLMLENFGRVLKLVLS